MSKELELLKQDSRAVSALRTAIDEMNRYGIFNFLRSVGRPRVVNEGKDVNANAHQGSWSVGYNDALEDILHLEERYLARAEVKNLPAMFGAASKLRGEFTEEELLKLNLKGIK